MKKITKRILCMVLAMVLLLSATSLASYAAVPEKVSFWDIVELGSYPQSHVKDSALISELDKVNKNWISYGYYSGNGEYGSMVQGNWMKYADLTYNGSKYRAVTFSKYRPDATTKANPIESKADQFKNGYKINEIYYFLYEPLKWRALKTQSNNVQLICDSIVDNQAFNNEVYELKNNGYLYYYNRHITEFSQDNNKYLAYIYKNSSLQKWLKKDFYNLAFDTNEKSKIYSICFEEDIISETYRWLDLTDNLNILNTALGATDYALSQGFYNGFLKMWWTGAQSYDDEDSRVSGLRSSFDYMTDNSFGVENVRFYPASVDFTSGIRPVISLRDTKFSDRGVSSATLYGSAYLGETAVVDVTVKGSPTKIRFVDMDNTITLERNNSRVKEIVTYSDDTERWSVELNVNALSTNYTIYAKYSDFGWYTLDIYPCSFTLKAKERETDKDVYSFSIDECYNDVMYAGVHKVTVETGVDATKVQFYKDGNTWTYSADNASYVIEDDKKVWSINMNFSELGEDMEYYIRTRSQKSAFEFTDQVMNVWVRFK